jgi:hypothetical protein
MEPNRAIEIVNALAAGADPFNGEVFASESILQHPDVVRALFLASVALKSAPTGETSSQAKKARLPSNAGLPWSASEDDELAKGFESGIPPKSLATAHQRTVGSIRSRLIKLGKLEAAPGDRY